MEKTTIDNIPSAVYIYMFQWLNGYDLSLLQYVNKYFGDLITDDLIEDGLKLVNTIVIGSYYNLGCDNIIIETKPICFQKYMHRIIKFNGDDYYIERVTLILLVLKGYIKKIGVREMYL